MTTPTPTPEAVEAAIMYAKNASEMMPATTEWIAAYNTLNKARASECDATCETAARILAAEVERLRGEHAWVARKVSDDYAELLKLRLETEALRAEMAKLKEGTK